MPGDDLRGVLQPPGGVAGVDALRAVAEVEVAAGGQAGAALEERARTPPRWCPGYVVDSRTTVAPRVRWRPSSPRRVLDVRQVRHAVAQRRRDGDDRDVESGAVGRVDGRPVAAGSEQRRQTRVGDVLDVRLADA